MSSNLYFTFGERKTDKQENVKEDKLNISFHSEFGSDRSTKDT